MTILLLADHNNTALTEHTARAVRAALQIDSDLHVLVVGKDVAEIARQAARIDGVVKVLHADASELEHQFARPLAALLGSLAPAYGTLVATAGSAGKSVMPRVAAALGVMQVSEIVAVLAPDTFRRPIYAGNALETVRSSDATRVITIRTSAFAPQASNGNAPVEVVALPPLPTSGRFIARDTARSNRPELGAAKIVVSGGRGLGSAQAFADLILPLADMLGAAVGASRAAVDAGYVANDLQVGQTGKVVAPDIYFAIGISGAIQHLAGMKDSRIIVAINSDPDAPIFQIADYGLVGDLFSLLPEMREALSR